MKILMIAPEPFFEPRGTPFSEYFRIKALTELGHKIDLATYHIGKDVEFAGLTIYRSLKIPFLRKVKVGPSWKKLFLDFFLFFTVLRLLFKNSYDCIHTHEEACFMGALLSWIWKIPHVYDMHSSLPQQFINFNVTDSTWIYGLLQRFEKWALRASDAIIAICPDLVEHAENAGVSNRVFVIENTAEASGEVSSESTEQRRQWKESKFGKKAVVLYTGTFEHYQGIDLLMESIPPVVRSMPEVLFLLIGGDQKSVARYRKKSEELSIVENVSIMEKVPPEEVVRYFEIADVLVSPRKSGTNTPLKIYSYLRSGKPIVATNLTSHTQVLNAEIAILTDPHPEAFALGILEALQSPRVVSMVERALQVAEEKYSYNQYVAKTSQLYAYILSLKKPPEYLNDNASVLS
ncbi:MAG TPA: glycosyltransferase family 4 protein [Acidobacteriota bacterium]